MEKYKEEIAENPKVTLIHVSQDSSEDAAEQWAAENKFPWLTVLPKDVPRSDLTEYRTRNVVPFYSLRDSEGNEVASGSGAAFQKIAELSSSSGDE